VYCDRVQKDCCDQKRTTPLRKSLGGGVQNNREKGRRYDRKDDKTGKTADVISGRTGVKKTALRPKENPVRKVDKGVHVGKHRGSMNGWGGTWEKKRKSKKIAELVCTAGVVEQ